MNYVLVSNDGIKYPYSFEHLKLDNRNVSFSSRVSDQVLAEWGVFPVVYTNKPECNSLLETVIEKDPVFTNNAWTQVWEIIPASEFDINQRKQEIKNRIIEKVQQRLDQFAQTRSYDNILSCCTYATDPNTKFAQEGQYCVQARSATWSKLYEILAEVEQGTKPMPQSYQEIEPELPLLQWPV